MFLLAFTPHGYCLLWKFGLVSLHLLGDIAIALAYFSIPLLLLHYRPKLRAVPDSIILLFAAFILLCGAGHLLEAFTLFHPLYWLMGWLKAITAVVSLFTAFKLSRLLPAVVALIQQHKLNSSALIESEERFRAFADNSPAVQWLKDSCGKTIYINKTYQQLFGDRLGLKDDEWLPPDAAAETMANDLQVLETGEKIEVVEIVPTPDGKCRHWLVSKFRLELRDESYCGGIAIDFTQQKEIELDLLQSNSQLNEFVYVAAHDLQAPLRAISSFMSRLESRLEGKLDRQTSGYIQRSIAAANRMKTLLDDLLAYSRTSRNEIQLVPVDLETVLKRVLETLAIPPQTLVTGTDLPQVLGDATQLEQLFQNLLSNALKFCCPNTPPRIYIAANRKSSTYWQIGITDNGIGIEREYHASIFKLFGRLHSSSEYEGTGLGLAICLHIVEQHQGKIWIDSAVGVGSTFYFTLMAVE